MTRVIKFRAWDKKENVWVDFPSYYDKEFISENANLIMEFTADPIIVWMQFTGLKDKNGEEIYEGDVVEINHNPEEVDKGFVSYNGSCFQVDFRGESEILEYLRPVEVIGNIYENPELLPR